MSKSISEVVALVLCGGSGTRLWPLSRALRPKQFVTLFEEGTEGGTTLFEHTLHRLDKLGIQRIILICNKRYRFFVAEAMARFKHLDYTIITEPLQKNTAPATTVGVLCALQKYGDVPLLLTPSDHVIGDIAAFKQAITKALPSVDHELLLSFGVKPEREETGFGYIIIGDRVDDSQQDVYAVASFKEKPDLETAKKFLVSQNCFWNSGLFMFLASSYMKSIEQIHPQIKQTCSLAYDKGFKNLDFFELDQESFKLCPEISIDYAVMEHANNMAMVVTNMRWCDMGSWDALSTFFNQDSSANRIKGSAVSQDSKNNIVFAGDKLISLLGIDNCVIADSEDAILVAHRSCMPELKSLVAKLNRMGRKETVEPRKVYRPWGSYETIIEQGHFKVKILTVNPQQSLSLQLHHHRSEHWVMVEGEAQITCGDKVFTLKKNESTYIPCETKHRIQNLGEQVAHLIEVQCGSYLGEDDIERFEDHYGRDKQD